MSRGYEYPFDCEEAPEGKTWQAAEWTKRGIERSLVVYEVRAVMSCPYCGDKHVARTRAPASEEDLSEWP